MESALQHVRTSVDQIKDSTSPALTVQIAVDIIRKEHRNKHHYTILPALIIHKSIIPSTTRVLSNSKSIALSNIYMRYTRAFSFQNIMVQNKKLN